MRPIPPQAIAIVKEFEGLRLTGYNCPAGIPTAGWGHTGDDVAVGVKYTRNQAEAWLRADLAHAASRLARVVKPDVIADLSDGQYAALLSFVFNLGAGANWTIWKRVNARQFDAVPHQLMRFVNAGGKRLPGLVRRRGSEAALWEAGDDDEPETPPSTMTRLVGQTPPTPQHAPATPVVTAALGAVGAVPVAAKQIQEAVEPYAGQSDIVAQALAGVATLAAIAAVIVLALTWMQRRAAKR